MHAQKERSTVLFVMILAVPPWSPAGVFLLKFFLPAPWEGAGSGRKNFI